MEALLDEAQQRRLTAAWTQLGRPDLYDVPSQTEEEDVRTSESRATCIFAASLCGAIA